MLSIICGLCFIVTNVYAGGVTDNNNGNLGDILVSTGENHGANSVGTWTDSSFLKGEKGDTGESGKDGINGKDGQNGNDGENGTDGKDGAKGDKGKQGEKGETGKGLKDSYELQLEGVLKETKKTATSVYYIRDFNNDHNTLGLKFKYYFGKSYSEQVREDLQRQIDELKEIKEANRDRLAEDGLSVVPVGDGYGLQKTINF